MDEGLEGEGGEGKKKGMSHRMEGVREVGEREMRRVSEKKKMIGHLETCFPPMCSRVTLWKKVNFERWLSCFHQECSLHVQDKTDKLN